MTWGPMGRGGECSSCMRLTAERDRLRKDLNDIGEDYHRLATDLAAANETLDRLREVVPEGWHWCADCEKMTPPDDEDTDFCGVCECENYWHRGVHVALQAILNPENET